MQSPAGFVGTNMNRYSVSSKLVFLPLLILFVSFSNTVQVAAQDSTEQLQIIHGQLEVGETHFYLLKDLQTGDRITASMRNLSGNLDPALGITDTSIAIDEAIAQYQEASQRVISENENIAQVFNELRDRFFLAWDDDGGEGYAAAMEYVIPEAGDYRIYAGSSLSTLGRATSGNYELRVGRNTVNMEDQPFGDPFVEREIDTTWLSPAVETVTGTLTTDMPTHSLRLADIRDGETLYIYVEPTSGDLVPTVILRDFGGKPLEAGNLDGEARQATLVYSFSDDAVAHTLEIGAAPGLDGTATTGDFQSLIGLNSPDVLTGQAITQGRAVLDTPIEVSVGIKMERISEVDSQNETFTMLGSIRMDWTDPALAFSPDSCNCTVKVYTEKEFDRFLADVESRWPDFVLFNQLGNRWVQSKVAVVWSDGRARFGESFTTTFQSDFDFQKFPLDTQEFPIYLDMLFPTDTYVLADLPGYTAISSDHGEDEFIITDFATEISTIEGRVADTPVSRFSFYFYAPRHLDYYVLQVFVPILLIILISWFTFFLRDFSRRIEAAAANILLFIAFSFSLADNYPRLGYITFLDAVMVVTFTVNTLVLLYNVYMKRLENQGHLSRIERVDRFFDWAYPLMYIVLIGIVALIFFR
jgi:hypothetical protein